MKIGLKPSKFLAAFLIVFHLSAALLLFPVSLPFWLKSLFFLLLSASLWRSISLHALLLPKNSLVALDMEEGRCSVRDKGGRWLEGELLGNSCVSPFLTVLNLKLEGSLWMRSMVILPDSLDPEEFRQLRVWLRWK